MNFTAIVNEIVSSTKRPDKILVARREVNQAVNFFTINQNFSRDLYEHQVVLDAQEYTQTFPFSVLTRFRRFKYIKRAGTKEYLDLLSSSEVGTSCDMKDKYYLAGAGVYIAMTKLATHLDVGYYQYPPYLTDADPEHWMLEAGWSMVFNRAIAKVFADIGDDASAKLHEGYARIDYEAFCADAPKDL